MISLTVGVCAYNEEKNIADCIDSILTQRASSYKLLDILVVCSGCTDGTENIVKEISHRDHRVRLLIQKEREGKCSAINLIISQAEGNIVALVNGDNRLEEGSLEHLMRPFNDPLVGMTGGHPIPVNSYDEMIGFAVHMVWELHHRLSLNSPKIGELVAFRKDGISLPTHLGSDEDNIRMQLERKGLRSVYTPNATVINKGPTTVTDFMKQRTRINIGEGYIKKLYDYDIPTQDRSLVIRALLDFLRKHGNHPLKIAAAIILEASARMYAKVYVALDKGDKAVWCPIATSKDIDMKD
ncbi:MAG: glycosyltransferase [Euryarchaeota archaeon]|nr:glycosyltransferase [Euryarchaeota archaeon]